MTGRSAGVRGIRSIIISTFDTICIVLVVVPTALAALATINLKDENAFILGILFTVAIFIVTAFLAGGGLTLVSIADNTEDMVRALRQMETAELRPIADDVHQADLRARIGGTEPKKPS